LKNAFFFTSEKKSSAAEEETVPVTTIKGTESTAL
jgi:hypothetical protein